MPSGRCRSRKVSEGTWVTWVIKAVSDGGWACVRACARLRALTNKYLGKWVGWTRHYKHCVLLLLLLVVHLDLLECLGTVVGTVVGTQEPRNPCLCAVDAPGQGPGRGRRRRRRRGGRGCRERMGSMVMVLSGGHPVVRTNDYSLDWARFRSCSTDARPLSVCGRRGTKDKTPTSFKRFKGSQGGRAGQGWTGAGLPL